jgi:hypothetical protein
MSQLDQIININIQLQTNAVPQPSFSIPLILGSANHFSDLIRYYNTPSAMLADGYLTSDLEYKHAVAVSSQALKPTQWGVGRRTAAVAQIITFTPTPHDNTLYTITINGVPYSFTSGVGATAASISAGLIAAITDPTVTPSGTNTVIVTANNAGQSFTYSNTSDLAAVVTAANHGIVEDIVAVQNASDLWYGVDITSNVDYDREDRKSVV